MVDTIFTLRCDESLLMVSSGFPGLLIYKKPLGGAGKCWFIFGKTSWTVAQHYSDTGSMSRVCIGYRVIYCTACY